MDPLDGVLDSVGGVASTRTTRAVGVARGVAWRYPESSKAELSGEKIGMSKVLSAEIPKTTKSRQQNLSQVVSTDIPAHVKPACKYCTKDPTQLCATDLLQFVQIQDHLLYD